VSAALDYRRLPVDPDQGLPQRFEVPLGTATFAFSLYASLPHDPREPLETLHDFAPVERPKAPVAPPGHLVLRVDRRDAAGARIVFLRKVVPDPELVHHAGELAILVDRVRIARGNVNAPGRLGSQIDVWVARRWA
jgi:hypothetical protein